VSIAIYLSRYKRELDTPFNPSNIKIALLSSFSARGLKETVVIKCRDVGVKAEIYQAPYNLYRQEILDEGSTLYAFGPELVFLHIDLQTLLGENFFHGRCEPHGPVKELLQLVEAIKKNSKATIVLHNMEVPTYSPFGIQDNKQSVGFVEAVQACNAQLRDNIKGDSRVFLFDYDGFASLIGKEKLCDPKMYYLGDMKLDMSHFPALADHYLAYIFPSVQLSRKCIVLDLDQTLWGGIVGEDGIGGIQLGPTPEGRPFWEFQKHLLALYERGIILAINSLNNFDDAIKVIREHPYMVLREEHFAAMKINWEDKVRNFQALAEDLNLTLDSFVFFDNDPVQRERIKRALPEVLVVDLPADPSRYVQTLQSARYFDTLQLTAEDKQRGEFYVARKRALEVQSLDEYLEGLKIEVTMERASELNMERIAQLTQKSNQFNMSTKRYNLDEIRQMAMHEQFHVACFRVKDKFADYGIVGVLILEKSKSEYRIDTFLLSCRVIGLGVENKMVAYAKELSQTLPLIAECIPTAKNKPAQDFFKKQDFSK
jgi:FkbH-like protein